MVTGYIHKRGLPGVKKKKTIEVKGNKKHGSQMSYKMDRVSALLPLDIRGQEISVLKLFTQ